MSLRVLATLLVTFFAVIGSFFDAFYGLIGYVFWSYTYPELSTWGLIPLRGLSFLMGFVLVLTTLLQKKRLWLHSPINTAIMFFGFLCFVSIAASGFSATSVWQFQFFLRVIIITLIITLLVDDLRRFRYYLFAIVIFIGLVSAQSAIKGTLAGQIGGVGKGFEGVLNDRNSTAVILCAIIPIVFYTALTEKRAWLRFSCFFIFFCNILAVILTYARAGFIGLASVGAFIILKAKNKLGMIILMASLIFILLNYFIPQPYIDRISGIKEGATEGAEGQDLSLISRLEAWRIAIEMIKDKPFVGVGFYRSGEVSDQYPDPEGGWRYSNLAIHNTFLKVAAETGLPALALYLYIFCSAYRTLTKIKARVRRAGMDKTIIGYATMLQVAFVGFFSSGFFVNASFLDISWHLVALSIALENIANKEMDKFMVANER